MYNHPRESIFYKQKDYYSTLEQVDQYIANSLEKNQEFEVIMGGDMNARVGDWAYTEDDDDDLNDRATTYTRESQDSFINIAGRTLIELCTTFGLTPLSGLKKKNFLSKFTFIGHRGSSIIDHCVVSTDLLENIFEFRTLDRVESNHLPIIMRMDSKNLQDNNPDQETQEPFVKLKWQEKKAQESLNILNNKITDKLLKEAEQQIENDIDNSLHLFNQAMENANKPMRQQIDPKKKPREKNIWFDKECRNSKINLKKSLRKLSYTNRRRNKQLYEQRKDNYLNKKLQYNKLIKEKKKQYKKETQEKLIENKNNSQKFWELIKKLTYKTVKIPAIKLAEWKSYFQNLLNPTDQEKNANNIDNEDRNATQETRNIEELDKEISVAEINQAIDKLKNGKSAGIDDISPELIKLAKPRIIIYVSKLLNEIYNKSYFPIAWMTSIIVPIHKKGSK